MKDDSQYLCGESKFCHTPAIKKAGIVKIAPAATDSPIEPTVLAKFYSRIVPLNNLKKAMLITAAGYVAAIVIPAFKPR